MPLELAGGGQEGPRGRVWAPASLIQGSCFVLGVAIKIPIVCVVLEGGPGTLHVSTGLWGGDLRCNPAAGGTLAQSPVTGTPAGSLARGRGKEKEW